MDMTARTDVAGFLERDLGVAGAYRAQGLVGIRPEMGVVGTLTPNLTLVDLGWGRKRASYRYLLCRSDGGGLGIQVVVDTTALR